MEGEMLENRMVFIYWVARYLLKTMTPLFDTKSMLKGASFSLKCPTTEAWSFTPTALFGGSLGKVQGLMDFKPTLPASLPGRLDESPPAWSLPIHTPETYSELPRGVAPLLRQWCQRQVGCLPWLGVAEGQEWWLPGNCEGLSHNRFQVLVPEPDRPG